MTIEKIYDMFLKYSTENVIGNCGLTVRRGHARVLKPKTSSQLVRQNFYMPHHVQIKLYDISISSMMDIQTKLVLDNSKPWEDSLRSPSEFGQVLHSRLIRKRSRDVVASSNSQFIDPSRFCALYCEIMLTPKSNRSGFSGPAKWRRVTNANHIAWPS